MEEFTVNTNARSEFINISRDVSKCIASAGIKNGTVSVYVPHTTAGVTINENADPDVMRDINETLERLVPWNDGYRHSEGNAAAHVKSSLMGSSARIPVENGQLQLGTWQGIYFCEFDGPRSRRVWVSQ
ncbi:MAG: secondary thiamine-phosphate synthase enzyme YjbQ [Verrucomicrobiota bacterium]